MPAPPSASRHSRGLSLVEVLIVIAVIAVITALAIPFISGAKDQAAENAMRRTAQVVASVAGSAQAAGNASIAEAADKTAAIELLAKGVKGDGVFAETEYRVSLEEGERIAVAEFLQFRDGMLLFDMSR